MTRVTFPYEHRLSSDLRLLTLGTQRQISFSVVPLPVSRIRTHEKCVPADNRKKRYEQRESESEKMYMHRRLSSMIGRR